MEELTNELKTHRSGTLLKHLQLLKVHASGGMDVFLDQNACKFFELKIYVHIYSLI